MLNCYMFSDIFFFNNGMLPINTRKVEKHSEKYYLINKQLIKIASPNHKLKNSAIKISDISYESP